MVGVIAEHLGLRAGIWPQKSPCELHEVRRELMEWAHVGGLHNTAFTHR